MCAKSLSDRRSSTSASESRLEFRRQNKRSIFLRFGFRTVRRQSIFPESPPPVIPVWVAASTLRSTSQQAREQRTPRSHRQAALSCLSSCQAPSLLLPALRQAAAAAQPLRPIADAATDPLPDKLRPHLP